MRVFDDGQWAEFYKAVNKALPNRKYRHCSTRPTDLKKSYSGMRVALLKRKLCETSQASAFSFSLASQPSNHSQCRTLSR